MDEKRDLKKRLKLWLKIGLPILFLAWIMLEAFLFGPVRLVLVEHDIPIAGLPEEWNGFRIVLLGDFHASRIGMDQDLIRRAIRLANRQNADLMLLLGDYLNGHSEEDAMPINEFFPMLAQLKAKYGVYAVIGNHDLKINPAKIIHALEENKIPVLNDRAVVFRKNGKNLHLAGLAAKKSKVNLKFLKAEEGEPVIVMTHFPTHYPKIPARVSLIAAADTHGGQFYLPLIGRPGVAAKRRKYAYGLMEFEPGKKMFVTSGIGTSRIRMRFNCPPEVVVLTLVNHAKCKAEDFKVND